MHSFRGTLHLLRTARGLLFGGTALFCFRSPRLSFDWGWSPLEEHAAIATTLMDILMDQEQPITCPHCLCGLTEPEVRSILGRFARSKRLSSLGASRFAKMTPEQRSAEASRAAKARWAKRKLV